MDVAAAVLCTAVAVVTIVLPMGSSATFCETELLTLSPSNDGHITSPEYPSHYPPDYCIIWKYYGRPGMFINIRFLDVDIPSYSDYCDNDFLRIGPINEHKYCGRSYLKIFEPYTVQMTNSRHRLKIVFNSTSLRTKGRGFKIHYQISDTLTTMSTAPTTSYSEEGSEADVSRCHFVLSGSTAEIITSVAVLNCLTRTSKVTWLIYSSDSANIDTKFEIIFKTCSLPYLDTLTIYDGFTNTDRILGRSIGMPCLSYLMSSHNAVFVEYLRKNTDVLPKITLQFTLIEEADTNMSPSTAIVTAVPPDYMYSRHCHFELTDHSGEIRSDYLSSVIQNSGFCTWLLHLNSTNGQKVTYTLTFDRFQLSPNSLFNVYDGANVSASILRNYFSKTHTLRSTQSSVFIYYNPGINVLSVGASEVFTVKYSAAVSCAKDYLACGYGEFACFMKSNRCDDTWDCPLHGGDERDCTAECLLDFGCGFRTSGCYSESERCNGKGICPNNLDERGCDDQLCSADKGLYLCRNRHCIYKTLRCNRINDCLDNSDEDGCFSSTSTYVIIATVASFLICALALVIAISCMCKVYRRRALHFRGPLHESPLSRQLSEMLQSRAPPPPYHEAMLTSRPYDEACLELLGQTNDQSELSGALNNGYQDIADSSPLGSQAESNNWPSSSGMHNWPTSSEVHNWPSSSEMHNWPSSSEMHVLQQQDLTDNQHPSSRLRPESDRLFQVGSLLLFSEGTEDGMLHVHTADGGLTSSEEPPAYSETDMMAADSLARYAETAWLGCIDNVNDTCHFGCDGESHTQMEIQCPSDDQASIFSLSHYNEMRSVQSLDSSTTDVVDEEEDKLQENLLDEDSDSDCILAGDDGDDDCDGTDSDTACILGEE